jgi:prophage maintenance system killer protein
VESTRGFRATTVREWVRAESTAGFRFVDGHKRTAFAATYTFLAINSAQLTASAEDAWIFVSGLYEKGEFSFDKLVPWLRSNVA